MKLLGVPMELELAKFLKVMRGISLEPDPVGDRQQTESGDGPETPFPVK